MTTPEHPIPIAPDAPQKVIRAGKLKTVRQDALQAGDIQLGSHETEMLVDASDSGSAPAGFKNAGVLCYGGMLEIMLKDGDNLRRVPGWVVLEDGRGLVFDRLAKKDGTIDLAAGELVWPGGAVFRPCTFKTEIMRAAESAARVNAALRTRPADDRGNLVKNN